MPRVHDGLFDGVASFEALAAAALRAVTGKRRTPVPAGFLANLETMCCAWSGSSKLAPGGRAGTSGSR